MSLPATFPTSTDALPSARPMRAFLLALGVALASGVALAAWSATSDRAETSVGALLPRGPLLDRLLDEALASPTQRAQAHQIFDAADTDLRSDRDAERVDHDRMAALFTQPTVDAVAVEALRRRIERRHDDDSRRTTQALLDVSFVLDPKQRQVIASRLAGGPHPFAAPRPFHPASAAL